jgi:hypothetical protein
MKKQIFILAGGLQRIAQNIENESYASVSILASEAPENVADASFTHTSVYATSPQRIAEYLNEAYKKEGISFSISGHGDEMLLDFNL